MIETFYLSSLYCRMNLRQKSIAWFNPTIQSIVSMGISLITAYLAFRNVELSNETLVTFMAYYLMLGMMTIIFSMRIKLTDQKTRQLLQFSYILFGFVLMAAGVLGMLNGKVTMVAIFMLILFLPGLATMRAGLHLNKTGE